MQSYALKFILLGDCRVGKSQLSRGYTKKTFDHDSQSTIGMEFSTRTIDFEKCLIKAQIWDTAGQERFDNMMKVYYRDAVGAALVYDISRKESFENVKTRWMAQVKEQGHAGMSLILVGNKADLADNTNNSSQREVTQEEAKQYAQTEGIDFLETSALTGYNVDLMFRRLILSTARLLPDIALHLELAALPLGWMLHLTNNDNTRKKRQSVTALNTVDNISLHSPSKAKEVRNQLNLEVDKQADRRFSQRVSSTPHASLRLSSTEEGATTLDSSSSFPPSRLSKESDSDNINKKLVVLYMNFWTGDVQSDQPDRPAPTGLLYTAEERKVTLAKENEEDRFVRASLDSRLMTERSSSARTFNLRRSDTPSQSLPEEEHIPSVPSQRGESKKADSGEEKKVRRCCCSVC